MKKYQMWLQQTQYNQHLTNLIKIKEGHSWYHKTFHKRQLYPSAPTSPQNKKLKSKTTNHFKQQLYRSSARKNDGSSSRMKSRFSELSKKWQHSDVSIATENLKMLSRLINTNSTISYKKQQEDFEHLHQLKNNWSHNNSSNIKLRESSLHKYHQLKSIKGKPGIHKFMINLCIKHLQFIETNIDSIRIELRTKKEKIYSETVSMQKVEFKNFQLPLRNFYNTYLKNLEQRCFLEVDLSKQLQKSLIENCYQNITQGYNDHKKKYQIQFFLSIKRTALKFHTRIQSDKFYHIKKKQNNFLR